MAVALRRTAFLDVSSLNFGGAKSTAVFFGPVFFGPVFFGPVFFGPGFFAPVFPTLGVGEKRRILGNQLRFAAADRRRSSIPL
jgi:hypothetical protein